MKYKNTRKECLDSLYKRSECFYQKEQQLLYENDGDLAREYHLIQRGVQIAIDLLNGVRDAKEVSK